MKPGFKVPLGAGLCAIVTGLASQGHAQSVAELLKQADAGNAVAEGRLGDKYASGDGAPKDPVKAFCWQHRAAEHGFPNAWLSVGMSYGMGAGVTKDNIESYKWFHLLNTIPEANKDPEISQWGKEDAARIARQMKPAEVAEAKRRADLWWKTAQARGPVKPNQMYVPYPGDRPPC